MPVTAVAFTNSVKYMITASKDGSLKRWDLHRLAHDSEVFLLARDLACRISLSYLPSYLCKNCWARTDVFSWASEK